MCISDANVSQCASPTFSSEFATIINKRKENKVKNIFLETSYRLNIIITVAASSSDIKLSRDVNHVYPFI